MGPSSSRLYLIRFSGPDSTRRPRQPFRRAASAQGDDHGAHIAQMAESPGVMGALPNSLFTSRPASVTLLEGCRLPLSKKAQRLYRRGGPAKRMPAPLPSGTGCCGSTLSIMMSPLRMTEGALPSALVSSARTTGRGVMPRMVSTSASRSRWAWHSPGGNSMTSPSPCGPGRVLDGFVFA